MGLPQHADLGLHWLADWPLIVVIRSAYLDEFALPVLTWLQRMCKGELDRPVYEHCGARDLHVPRSSQLSISLISGKVVKINLELRSNCSNSTAVVVISVADPWR